MNRLFKCGTLNPLGGYSEGVYLTYILSHVDYNYMGNYGIYVNRHNFFKGTSGNHDAITPVVIHTIDDVTGEKMLWIARDAGKWTLDRINAHIEPDIPITYKSTAELEMMFGEYNRQDDAETQKRLLLMFVKSKTNGISKEENSDDDHQGVLGVSQDCLQQESEIPV